MVKISNSKYEVYIANLKHEDGKELPTVPYDVVLEDGKWKLDRSTISIIPKEEIKKITDSGYIILPDSPFYKSIVSENEYFYIKKQQKNQPEFGIFDWRTYTFNTISDDIYGPGEGHHRIFPWGKY